MPSKGRNAFPVCSGKCLHAGGNHFCFQLAISQSSIKHSIFVRIKPSTAQHFTKCDRNATRVEDLTSRYSRQQQEERKAKTQLHDEEREVPSPVGTEVEAEPFGCEKQGAHSRIIIPRFVGIPSRHDGLPLQCGAASDAATAGRRPSHHLRLFDLNPLDDEFREACESRLETVRCRSR